MSSSANPTSEHLDTDEERSFRLRAREYLAGADLPPRRTDEPSFEFDDDEFVARDRRIQRALFDGGFAGIPIPTEYGGQGLPARYDEVFIDEARPYRMPWSFGVNHNVVIPTILAHASEDVKRRFIPPMLRGEQLWCQLLSEPSGGSDLAGLLTRATRDGDVWRINGAKIWTTGGNQADWGVCLARTDPDVTKHAGLTMFCVDMRQPGMTVRPLRLADRSAHFCEEFLDDVIAGADDTVGAVNDGWRATTTMLMFERAAIGRGWDYGKQRARSDDRLTLSPAVTELVRSTGRADDPLARQLLAEVWVLDTVLGLTSKRVATGMSTGQLPGHAAAMLKLLTGKVGSKRMARVSELAGPLGVASPIGAELRPDDPMHDRRILDAGIDRVVLHGIGGGTTEMQANNVGERLLGLPREPSNDRDVPFTQLRHNTVPGAERR